GRRAALGCLAKIERCSAVKPASDRAVAREGSSLSSAASRAVRPNAAASKTESFSSGGRSSSARSVSPAYRALSASLTGPPRSAPGKLFDELAEACDLRLGVEVMD